MAFPDGLDDRAKAEQVARCLEIAEGMNIAARFIQGEQGCTIDFKTEGERIAFEGFAIATNDGEHRHSIAFHGDDHGYRHVYLNYAMEALDEMGIDYAMEPDPTETTFVFKSFMARTAFSLLDRTGVFEIKAKCYLSHHGPLQPGVNGVDLG